MINLFVLLHLQNINLRKDSPVHNNLPQPRKWKVYSISKLLWRTKLRLQLW